MSKKLNLTANGNTPVMHGTGSPRAVVATGTWGGGSLGLQVSPDDGASWVADPNVILTADGVQDFNAPVDMPFRFALSGATSPDINIGIF